MVCLLLGWRVQFDENDILDLIKASLDANYTDVRSVSNKLAKQASEQDAELSKKIKSVIKRKGVPLQSSGFMEALPVDQKTRSPLVEEEQWPVVPLFLNEDTKDIFESFIMDILNIEKLIEHGLGGKLNLLLSGPPGTGKTLLAGHIASQLGRPLYTVRLDSLVSSMLGDTAKNIRAIFDFISSRNGILFIDEVDAIAKLRNDTNELGELKRVVNTLIQGMDSLDDKTVVISATNHPELLDPAIWRRFPYKIKLDLPTEAVRHDLWNHYLYQDSGKQPIIKVLAKISQKLSCADIEEISKSARRKSILLGESLHIPGVVETITDSSLVNITTVKSKDSQIDKKKISLQLSKEFNLTQSDISVALQISRQTVSSYLRE